MDYFNRILKHLEKINKINGVIIDDMNLTHLLFAADILLFVEDDDTSIKNLQIAIHMFEQAAGLNINLNKSSISPINVTKERIYYIAQRWGMSTIFLPTQYLGMSLRGKPRTLSFWNNRIVKVYKKLSWKYAHISKEGRLTLINSTLSSLLTYQLSIFKSPNSVCNMNEKYWRHFLWKGNYDNLCINEKHKKMLILIKWTIVINSRDKGGLRITSISDTNFALLTK